MRQSALSPRPRRIPASLRQAGLRSPCRQRTLPSHLSPTRAPGLASRPPIRLRWDGAEPGQIALPRLRALFVGVNHYTSPRLTKLGFAAKDATELAAFFKSQEGKSYSKVEAKALPDAKRLDVLGGLQWLENGSEEGDVNLLFLAGHGMTDEQQHFYFMAADSDPDQARGTGVSRDELLRTIRNLRGTRVVMLDACHSGASADAAPATQSRVDMNRLANEIGDRSLGILLYASARGRQYSYERAEWGNGAFTRAMLDGLAGAAEKKSRLRRHRGPFDLRAPPRDGDNQGLARARACQARRGTRDENRTA